MKLTICDTHNDFLTELPAKEIKNYIFQIAKQGVEIVCASFFTSQMKESSIIKNLLQKANLVKSYSKTCLLHIEDLFWLKTKKQLNFLIDLKPFSCSLTWNNKNLLATGSAENGGITNWGRFCLNNLINTGVVVDLAHLNRKSFWQVAKIIKTNLYCSHTGFCAIKKHKRNLSNKQINAIVKSNGFIGLFFYDNCVKVGEGEFMVDDIVLNLKFFVKRWGCDNIGIGTDFFGIKNYPKNLNNYSNFANLYNKLQQNGFSTKQIKKIFYKNFKNFLERVKRNTL